MLQIKMKKWTGYLLVMLCLAMSAAVGVSAPLPAGKDEVVYANLAADGAVEMIYVVNAFTLEQDGTVTDYGDYSILKNLTNKAELYLDGDKITANAEKGRFYYQGTLKTKDLPWLFQLQYFLNGREVAPEELAGAGGQLTLSLQVRQNPAVDVFFFNNYTLQVTITLDSERCREIEAEGATVATVGKNRIITYTLLPGMEKTFTLKAQVSDFAMDGIQLNAVPLQFDLGGEGLFRLTGAFGGLVGGLAELANGTEEIHKGASGLRDALAQVRDGAETLERGSRTAAEGAKQFAAGLKTVADGMKSSENALAEITGGLQELAGENSSLQAGAAAIFDAALATANRELAAQISLPGITIPALTRDNYSRVLAGLINTLEQYGAGQVELAALSALQEDLAGMDAFYQGLVAYTEGVRNLSEGGGRLLAGMAELARGTETLQAEAVALSGGNEELANGLGELGASLARLEEGAGELATGAGTVSEAAGTLQAATAKMDEEVEAAIPSARRCEHFAARSFVSPKNKNVDTLQFVFKTAGIHKAAKPTAAAPEKAEEDFGRNYWTFSGAGRLKAAGFSLQGKLTGCFIFDILEEKLFEVQKWKTTGWIAADWPVRPVVETKKLLDKMTAGTLEVLVDNETAKNNVLKLAASLGLAAAAREDAGIYTVTIIKEEQAAAPKREEKRKSLLLAQDTFGLGDEELGRILMKSFLYALAESDNLPEAIYLVNGGVKLACSTSPVLDAMQRLEALGVKIYSCGLCLDYFQLKDSLEVGEITNMYAIVEQIMTGAVIRL